MVQAAPSELSVQEMEHPFPLEARLKIQKDYESNKEYQKSQAHKTKRVMKRKKLYKPNEGHQEEVKYQKNIMLLESRARGKNTIIPNQLIKHFHIR